ncbi:hypothetical protein AJ78_01796 [Emergomyces pasteurianus Ep9510]|uniref:FAD/NAD(P)-binding domain-containing protein n=1 Tax=Emergomyces pasteurianus Ep9510 TaxID=1447872 RepID=A0A1J9QPT1_9EURO|nr:hypothetical protein AJ78_01796 [Emergomyces pasteurianus Ep9510]
MGIVNDIKYYITHLYINIFASFYLFGQWVLAFIFAPAPPPPASQRRKNAPRIAIIGAGLTGVSAASHCVGHGFEVKIFDARSKKEGLGGIWSRVNSTSELQIHSLMFRFHPAVKWDSAYPTQSQIKNQIIKIWKNYDLERRTVFNTLIKSIDSHNKDGKWVINNSEAKYGTFDGVIAAVGSCGDPKMPYLPHQDQFEGKVFHSSDLDGIEAKGKRVIVVGGGASAIEALEYAVKSGAAEIDVLSRSDKWIIPRNIAVDALLASNVFGQETSLSWIPEWLLRKFFYRDLSDIAPAGKGIFTDTPMVNSELFDQIRAGKARWLRGDIISVEKTGVMFNHRSQGVPKGGPGHEIFVKADIIVMATGYSRPSLSFLPDEVFQPPYDPPNWYLQVFPPQYPSICANNSTYVNAIGTVGNYHIGIYTRLLLMFLVDPLSRPTELWMKRWIDMTRLLKRFAPTGAFDFFTYSELLYWFLFVVVINPFRWKWAAFVFFGVGRGLPMTVVAGEDLVRELQVKSKSENAA